MAVADTLSCDSITVGGVGVRVTFSVGTHSRKIVPTCCRESLPVWTRRGGIPSVASIASDSYQCPQVCPVKLARRGVASRGMSRVSAERAQAEAPCLETVKAPKASLRGQGERPTRP